METKHSQVAYRDSLDAQVREGTRWLDIGCGNSIIPTWLRGSVAFQTELMSRCDLVCGCDPVDDRPHLAGMQKYVGPCDVLPYPDQHFNLVTANMVVEHVEHPEVFFGEVSRVLSDGGRLLLHTPNIMYLPIFLASIMPTKFVRSIAKRADGREDEEIFRTYYRVNSRRALQNLPGFRPVEIRCVETGPVLAKIPVANWAESALIRLGRRAAFEDLRADWIALLEKIPGSPR